MDLRPVFASNLQRIRHLRGLSQEELANDCGMSRSYLGHLEKGNFYVSVKIIGKLAGVLGVDPAEFFRLKEKQKR